MSTLVLKYFKTRKAQHLRAIASALQKKDPPPQRARVFELEIWLFVIRGGRLTSPSNLVEYAS
jgi:hypothetical protein